MWRDIDREGKKELKRGGKNMMDRERERQRGRVMKKKKKMKST